MRGAKKKLEKNPSEGKWGDFKAECRALEGGSVAKAVDNTFTKIQTGAYPRMAGKLPCSNVTNDRGRTVE